MKLITVFTPTYNRAYTLDKLYKSLCEQTVNDFVWLVVDDGSIDDTESLVKKWIDERCIDIIYYKQENRGKMVAHNLGVRLCSTELFVCVDSDDFLATDSIEKICSFWKKNKNHDVAGIIAYRAVKKENDFLVEKEFPSLDPSTLHSLYENGFQGDTTLIFKTEVIKEYPFPEIEGEKFITEAYSYDQIDQKYKYLLLNSPLTLCEYRPDGYTCNTSRLYFNNPKGCALYYNQLLKLYPLKGLKKMKVLMRYIAFSRIGKNKFIYRNSNERAPMYLIAWILSFRFGKQLEKRAK